MGERMFTSRIPIDSAGVHVTDRHVFAPRPMIGCIGTAPAEGMNSTIIPSSAQGGNMDVTDCGPGSIVYLHVMVEGVYLSIGDIHAFMAEGGSSFIAIEAEGIAVVSVELRKGMNLRAPRVQTLIEWVFVGLGDPVQERITRGYEDVFYFLVSDHGWDDGDAVAVMSAVGHSRLGGPTGSGTVVHYSFAARRWILGGTRLAAAASASEEPPRCYRFKKWSRVRRCGTVSRSRSRPRSTPVNSLPEPW
ncbi:hypothetical protein E3T41_08510 [Cryobacterium sp. Hh38]|nr:hypothetical protein E3T41_08510 [Cryobacterium sp. Hh38]